MASSIQPAVSATASSTSSDVLSPPSAQNTVIAAVLITTTLGLFVAVAIVFYALHRGRAGLCPRCEDEEIAASHTTYKPDRGPSECCHLKEESEQQRALSISKLSQKIENEDREYRRERLVNNSRRCKDLMLQKYRVDDIPATYDCPFNHPSPRSHSRRPIYTDPFRDNYQNSIVNKYTSSLEEPARLRQRRCFSDVPPASMHCRYDRDIVLDYLNRHRPGPAGDLRADQPSVLHNQASDDSPFRTRRVSPRISSKTQAAEGPSTLIESRHLPAVELRHLVPGIVSDEVRSRKSPVNSQRRSRQSSKRSVSEPLKLSRFASAGSLHLSELRDMLRTHQESSEGRESVEHVTDGTVVSSVASTIISSISIAAPCYKDATTGRIPIQALLVADVSPVPSRSHITTEQ